jgi:hypothetical protein
MKFLETTIKMLDRNDAELFKKHLVSKKASKKTLELFNLISDKKNLDASVIARKTISTTQSERISYVAEETYAPTNTIHIQ